MRRRRPPRAKRDDVAPVGLVAQLAQPGQPAARVDRGQQGSVRRRSFPAAVPGVPGLQHDRLGCVPQLRHAGQQRLAAHEGAILVPRSCQRVEPAHVDVEAVHAGIQAHLVVDDDVWQHAVAPCAWRCRVVRTLSHRSDARRGPPRDAHPAATFPRHSAKEHLSHDRRPDRRPRPDLCSSLGRCPAQVAGPPSNWRVSGAQRSAEVVNEEEPHKPGRGRRCRLPGPFPARSRCAVNFGAILRPLEGPASPRRSPRRSRRSR